MKKKFSSFLLVITLIGTVLLHPITGQAIDYTADVEQRKNRPIESNQIAGWPDGPIVNADAAILMEANTGTILYAKNIYSKQYPASTTKLLTTLIAYENCKLDETVYFSRAAIDAITWDSSNMGMKAGDSLTMEQALYGILVGSANESANAVGEHISGSMSAFATLMNTYADELGCVNSHFVNANGLYDDEHYTCAYDLAIIAQAFFRNELLCKMSSTYSYKVSDTKSVYSHNKLLKNREYEYEYLVGSKTGYTDKARQTLVSCAQKDGMKLICVVLKEEVPYQFSDTVALFNYGFSNFHAFDIADNETELNVTPFDFIESQTDIFGDSKSLIQLEQDAKIILPITSSFRDARKELQYLPAGSENMATITYYFSDVEIGNCDIYIDTNSLTDTDNIEIRPDEDNAEQLNEPKEKVIFINIKHVLFWLVGITGVLIIVFSLIKLMKDYHFGFSKRRRRRRRR